MSNILNLTAMLSDFYRFVPVNKAWESSIAVDLPRADIYSSEDLRYVYINDAIEVLAETRPTAYGYDMREQLAFLFGAMVAELSPQGIVTKYKTVNHAPEQCRFTWGREYKFDESAIISEQIKINRFMGRFTNLHQWEIDRIGAAFVQSRDPEAFKKTVAYYTTDSRQGFAAVYGDNVPETHKSKGPYKDLHGSCMQGRPEGNRDDFSGYGDRVLDSWNEIHPCESYASGDFVLHYLKDNATGHVLARAIQGNDNTTGPIYAAHKMAGDCLRDLAGAATGLDFAPRGDADFRGLNMLCLVSSRGLTATPYLDCDSSGYMPSRDGFKLGNHGQSYGNTSGFTDLGDIDEDDDSVMCDRCGDYESPDSVTHTADGDCVCRSCRRTYYTESGYSGEWINDNDLVDAISESGAEYTISQGEADSGHFVYSEHLDTYVHRASVITTVCGAIGSLWDSAFARIEDSWYIVDSEEHIAALALENMLYCQRPIARDPDTADLFRLAA